MFSKVFGTRSQREVKRIMPLVEKIESLRPDMQKLSDEELRGKTREFKKRLEEGETLDDLLPEAFAVVREAGKRVLGMEHFRVQLIGGIILHQGRIAEMRTGEGKTLVATLPSYLNALEGKGVHVVTVNDYLAKRDAEEMGKIHEFLGLTVGVVLNDMKQDERRAAYNCDVTYVTNNELGFDYLRDNLKTRVNQMVQRPLVFAIVDEVDSILIDEARTPLIISGRGKESSEKYLSANRFVKTLTPDVDFTVDIKEKSVQITESGSAKAERFFNLENLADIENADLNHHIQQALKAHYIFRKDNDYIVNDGEVTALAGSMEMNANCVLGISMGTSVAGGYVNREGNITDWLNELAFVPVDYREGAPADEWSGDLGCAVQYFCQQGVARLVPLAGIELPKDMKFAEQLKEVQKLMEAGDERAAKIYESIGVCFGYTIARYCEFYDMEKLLILGRVTTGKGGDIILAKAAEVLKAEFPELSGKVEFRIPDEKGRRHGQAVAAASLPVI